MLCSGRISFPKFMDDLLLASSCYHFKNQSESGECTVAQDKSRLISCFIHCRSSLAAFLKFRTYVDGSHYNGFWGAAESNRKQKISILLFGKIAVSVRRRLHYDVLPPDAPHIARLSRLSSVCPLCLRERRGGERKATALWEPAESNRRENDLQSS